jgi:hypothetical protein
MSGHVQVSLTPRPKVSAMTATRVHIERLAEPFLVWCNAYRHHGASRRRERVAYLTAAGEAAIEAALPYWHKAQERIAALVQPSAIGELADQLEVAGARE